MTVKPGFDPEYDGWTDANGVSMVLHDDQIACVDWDHGEQVNVLLPLEALAALRQALLGSAPVLLSVEERALLVHGLELARERMFANPGDWEDADLDRAEGLVKRLSPHGDRSTCGTFVPAEQEPEDEERAGTERAAALPAPAAAVAAERAVVVPPWSEELVALLNREQACGTGYPALCGLPNHALRPTLVATRSGWSCPDESCDAHRGYS